MKKIHYLFFITLFLGTSGCWSHLKVKVCVLKIDYLNEPEVMKNQLIRFAHKEIMSDQWYYQLGSDLKLQFETTMAKFDTVQFPARTRNTIQTRVDISINKRINEIIGYNNNVITLLNSLDTSKEKSKENILNKCIKSFTDSNKALNSLKDDIQSSINNLKEFVGADDPKAKTLKKNTEAILANTIDKFSDIYNDPLASVIINAPNKYWKATTNEAKATTVIGNADIAILMNDEGNYSIKGVRNDASQATKAIFSVTNVAIQSLSKAYGVGFSLPSSTNDTTNNYFKQSYQVQYDLDKYVLKTKAAKIAVMQSIIDEDNVLSNISAIKTKTDSVKYFNAIHNIQNTIKLQKQLLLKQ